MILFGLIACFVYEYFRTGTLVFNRALVIISYFSLVIFVASISLAQFPLSGDEVLYFRCGENISQLISQGVLLNFPLSSCYLVEVAHFVRVVGYLFYLFGSGPLTIVSWNIFILFVAIDLMLKTFDLTNIEYNKIFYKIIFFPPIFYLAIRPAKEATIAFLISLVCFSLSRKNVLKIIAGFAVSIFLTYWLRWQYVIAFILALMAFVLIKTLDCLSSNKKRLSILLFIFVVVFAGAYFKGQRLVSEINQRFIHLENVREHAQVEHGAFIYKLMLYKNGENPLHPWNIMVAHVGGLMTPHPLRFLKEKDQNGSFRYNILEEFFLASIWFYLLLPFYFFYIKKDIILPIYGGKDFSVYQNEIFKFILVSILFSLSCFSLLFVAPQLFRYKIPLNVYLFVSIAVFILRNNFSHTVFRNRFLIFIYFLILIVYSVFYLIPKSA